MISGCRILVTGGCGAIGSNLVRRLCDKNEVVVIDNLSSGRVDSIDESKVILYRRDIRDEEIVSKVMKKPFDVVFHLAANFANQNSVDNPMLDLDVNVKGTLILLRHAVGCGRFVYASTSGVYGTRSDKSEDSVGELETPYYVHKYVGELYVDMFAKLYGLKATCVRIFNSYGPYEYAGEYRNVVPNFFDMAMRGESLRITGDGDEVRDFTYVDDIVTGLCLSAENVNAVGKVFNLGYGTGVKIIDLARSINALCGRNPDDVRFVERRSWDHIRHRICVNDRAKKELGWEPLVMLGEGLKIYKRWLEGAC